MRPTRLRLAPFALLLALVIACAPAAPPAEETGSGTHDDLLQLFDDFRVFQEPAIVDGAPDYTAEAMEAQRQGLEDYKRRLQAIDISEWTISEQIDHHLVRAEMNGLDFHHRVTRPWSRDPAFYLMSQGGAGPAMSGFRSLFRLEPPFDEAELEEYRTTLQAVPKVYEQARSNLTEAVPDLGTIAIWAAPREARIYDEVAEQLAEHHPESRRRRRDRPRRGARLRRLGRGEQAVVERRRRHRQGELRLVAAQRPPLALRLGGEPDDRRAGVQPARHFPGA